MSDIKVMKYMLKVANKDFKSPWAQKITIYYDLKKANELNSLWTIGDTFQYDNVPCLREIVTQATFADGTVSNVVISKGNFYIPWDGYDFKNNEKRNIQILIGDQTIKIDKVTPLVPLINERWIYWALIQK